MYADRYNHGPTVKPGSLGLALAATALPLVALVAGLQVRRVLTDPTTIKTYQVPEDQPRPPDLPPPRPHPRTPDQPVHETIRVPDLPPVHSDNRTATTADPPPTFPPPGDPPVIGAGNGGAGEPVKAVPVVIGAQLDPHYNHLLQPPYPPEEQRAGRSGRVVLRVLVGPNGHVRQVERLEATSDAFFAAAQRQALTKWRFRPATRDGVPIEQWKQMSLRFEINDL